MPVALVLVTEWPEFRIPNFKLLSRIMKEKVIFEAGIFMIRLKWLKMDLPISALAEKLYPNIIQI